MTGLKFMVTLKKIELVGGFSLRLFRFAMKNYNLFVLLVGELKYVYFPTFWQGIFYLFTVCFYLCITSTEAHVHTKLAHRESQIE